MGKHDRPRFSSQVAQAGIASAAQPLSDAQRMAAVRRFVAQVGGIEKARSALELLALLTVDKKAA